MTATFREWVKARLREIGMTQGDLAKRIGLSAASLSELLREKRGLDLEEAARLADALGVSLVTVAQRFGIADVRTRDTQALDGFVGADGVIRLAPGSDRVAAAPGVRKGEAYMVEAALGGRCLPHKILYTSHDAGTAPDDWTHRECVCRLADGRIELRMLLPGTRPGAYMLVSLTSHSVETDVAVVSAAPVVWHLPFAARG